MACTSEQCLSLDFNFLFYILLELIKTEKKTKKTSYDVIYLLTRQPTKCRKHINAEKTSYDCSAHIF